MLKLDFRSLEAFVSAQRLQRYLKEAEGNHEEAVRCYLANLDISRDIYALLHWLEVGLRNRINNILIQRFGELWFASDALVFSAIEQQQLTKARESLAKERKSLDNGRIVASLHFGFWINLFNSPYEELWRHCLRQVFSGHPAPLARKFIRVELGHIHRIRNRVAHYEPISLREVNETKHRILQMIQWMGAAQLAHQLQSH